MICRNASVSPYKTAKGVSEREKEKRKKSSKSGIVKELLVAKRN